MMYASSLPKIAILFSAFVLIERGELNYADIKDDLSNMIRYSSNKKATKMLGIFQDS